MDKPLLTILLALVAGAAGGAGAQFLVGQAKTGATVETDNTALLEAMQRIEARLDEGSRTGLRGSAPAGATGGVTLEELLADDSEDSPLKKLLARIEESVGKSVQGTIQEMSESDEGFNLSIGTGKAGKKKVSFDEMSRELELSAEEEAKLREVMKETETEALKLLADERPGHRSAARRAHGEVQDA